MKAEKQTSPARKPRFSLRSLITSHKIAFAVCAALLVVILVADISDRLRFAGVEREMVKISDTIIEPLGATKTLPMTGQGNGLWEKIVCGTDVYCPYVQQGWVVAIEPGQESEFLESVLYQAGYGPKPEDVNHPCILPDHSDGICREDGKNGTYTLGITLYKVNPIVHKIPTTDVGTKIWRFISISIEPTFKD